MLRRWLSQESSRESLLIVLMYTAAWGLLLGASGRYWDDWCVLNAAKPAIDAWSQQEGLFWQLRFFGVLSALPGTERIGHVLVFASYLFGALAVHRLMREIPGSTIASRVMVPAIFAVFPVNDARYALVDLSYALSLAIFTAAWWMIVADIERPRLVRRVAAGGLFLFSMLSTNSLLVFFGLVPLYLLWIHRPGSAGGASRWELVRRYAFLIALPIVAWIVRSAYLQPSGLYANYNELRGQGDLYAVGRAFGNSVWSPALAAFPGDLALVLVFGIVLFAVLAWVFKAVIGAENHDCQATVVMLFAGVVTFVAGVYPYLAVGKMPESASWASRHQLLVPFGAALIVVACVQLIGRVLHAGSTVQLLALCVLVSAFVFSDVNVSLRYQRDWYKQVALMSQMGRNPDVRRGSYFVLVDKTKRLNERERRYVAYELNGMMRHVFGDATRFGVDEAASASESEGGLGLEMMVKHQQYNCWQYKPTKQRYSVIVDSGSTDVLSRTELLRLMWQEVFAPAAFSKAVGGIVTIRTQPFDER